MGVGASTEQPAGGAEGFHLHGVSRPGAAAPVTLAGHPQGRSRTPDRGPEDPSGGVLALMQPPGGEWCPLPGGNCLREAAPLHSWPPAGLRSLSVRPRPNASC